VKLDGIFLDMYGTLTAGDRAAVESVCRRLVTDFHLGLPPHALAVEWGTRFFVEIERCNGPTFRTLFELEKTTLIDTMTHHGIEFDPLPYTNQLRDYWRNPPLHAEVRESLARLALPVFIVSNADRHDIELALANNGLAHLPFVTSECARSYKPDAAVFRAALARTGWNPRRVIHVGDSLHSDVGGAKSIGLHTGWLCREDRILDVGQTTPDFVFSHLGELADWACLHNSDAVRSQLA